MKNKTTINLNTMTIRGNQGLRGFQNKHALNVGIYEEFAKKHKVEYTTYKYLYAKAYGKESIL